MEEEEAQLQQFFSACESGSSTSSRTLSEGEDTATDVAVMKVCGDAGADCRNFQTEEGKCNAEDHHDDDDDGSDEDEKVKRICSE